MRHRTRRPDGRPGAASRSTIGQCRQVEGLHRDSVHAEVASQLAIPEGTAKSRLRAALHSLADHLAAEGILER